MRIIVPSLGRVGKASSMKWLLEARRDITFAVHADEAEAYQKAYCGRFIGIDCSVNVDTLILSDECRHHVGLLRREIMQRIREPFFFVDDDIRVSLKGTTSIAKAFDILERHLHSGASMAGFGPQLFSTFAETIIVNDDPFVQRDKFVATVYAINPPDFDTCPLETLPVYEDAALVIHAIQRGGTIVTFVATHNNVSPPEGGCNAWRDPAITLQCLNEMVRLYPEVCSIKATKNSTHSQQLGVGLRVAWAKIKKLN